MGKWEIGGTAMSMASPRGLLSPVLFKIYLLDLLEEVSTCEEISFKFADDATVKIRKNLAYRRLKLSNK